MSSSASYLIISSMKNEAAFVLEWIAYHRVIGFTDFLIYTNDCEDSTVPLLERLQELGVVTHQANQVLRRGPHKSALKAAKGHTKTQAADWVLVSDIDEFLVVHSGNGQVQDLIDHMPDDTDVIPITWRLFGHNDQVEYRDDCVIEQFTDAELALENGGATDRFAKSLFRRSDGIGRFGIHGPKDAETLVWRRPSGTRLGSSDNLTRPVDDFAYEVAQINHYAVGSIDGFLVKKDRGRANHWRHDLGLDYWKRLCRGGERDASAHRHLAATQAEMARLLEDPQIRDLHEAGVAWRKSRIAELRQDPRFEEMRSDILKLSKEGAHRRPRGHDEAQAVPPEASAIPSRLEVLCAEMRELMAHVSPHANAEMALDRLDEIERGLFGKVRTEQ